MKKSVLFGLTLGAFISVCALGCSNGSSDPTSDDSNGTIGSGSVAISFNIKDAKALAGASSDSSKSAREATESSKLMKILSDGSVESAISVPEGLTLSNVTAVLQAPSHSDIFIVFDQPSWGGYWDEKQNIWINNGISQLICVHEDGSYDDILGWFTTENNSGPKRYLWCNSSDYSNCIKFDENGNIYYLSYESSGNSSASVFYQYNPTTNHEEQLTAAIPNLWYNKFDVSKDGKYLFVEGNSYSENAGSDNFLKVIPVDDPDEISNIKYGEWGFSWVYDNYTGYLYLSENTWNCNGQTGGISRFSSKDGFEGKEWIKKSGYYLYTYADGHTEEKTINEYYDTDPEHDSINEWGWDDQSDWDWPTQVYFEYQDLTATKGGIWGTTYDYTGATSKYSVIRILDADRNYDGTICNLPEGYASKGFISTSTNLFALADIMKDGSKSGYQTLFKIASTGGEWSNIFENTPNPNKTNIVSWSASNDGSTVFFSGVKGRTITNGTITASTGSYNEISSGTKFSCITALY